MHRSILIVEDELVVAGDIRLTLERAGYTVSGIARSYHSAMDNINASPPGLVLLDIFLKGDLTGIDVAGELNKRDIPFVYLSANCNTGVLEMAKVTQPSGFIVKPFREKDLLVTLDIARYRHDYKRKLIGGERKQRGAEFPAPGTTANRPDGPGLNGIIGSSPNMLGVFNLVKEVGPLDTSVLILGESGTGKEGIANCLHHLSGRRKNPFVKLNCAALPPNLVESELFGHEKGSFTGAYDRRIGKFEQADGGTLFLDEIGEMQTSVQVKLLRVLQEREIERIGGRETIKVNVRIIAATNCNLEKALAEGKFRLDLYYRLNVFPVILPPLRERKGDIPLLVNHFIKMFAQKTNKPVEGISGEAMARLVEYSWPGNVRELQNLIERSVLMSNETILQNLSFSPLAMEGQYYSPEAAGGQQRHPEAFGGQHQAPAAFGGEQRAPEAASGQVKTIAEMEREHILSVLRTCKGRISGPGGAASLLNLPASTLKSKMKKLGIEKIYKG